MEKKKKESNMGMWPAMLCFNFSEGKENKNLGVWMIHIRIAPQGSKEETQVVFSFFSVRRFSLS